MATVPVLCSGRCKYRQKRAAGLQMVCVYVQLITEMGTIHIYSYCNGLMRIGQTNGELTNRRIDNVQLINGIVLGIETWNNRIVNVSLNTNHSGSTLEDGEGLCMFSPGSYKHRDGTEETDSDGFVSSWRYNYTSYLSIEEYYSREYNVHWGYIRCFAEKICKVNHSGDGEWSGSLLPAFSVTSVEARMEIR
ncbi:uncharacterized protein LOC128552670 [Mercenaria mercenaria]|uniref:uncharacterized protein LOC128552670 n=1 Tax=Mercenaria mercenaria TaxID=6596 RepID=UPI00234FAAC6|nr:uncharacterized protein LOC128552670 [Mercenaria mercenaria]